MLYFLHLYKSTAIFDKTNYTAGNREKARIGPGPFHLSNGYFKEGTMFLPGTYRSYFEKKEKALLVIIDDTGKENTYNKPVFVDKAVPFHYISGEILKSLELFKIRNKEGDIFELFLDYKANVFRIGVPNRTNHKIAELTSEKSILYRLNGKSDFTMTGRKQRTFYEFEYLFEPVKKVEHIEFKDISALSVKQVPNQESKIIDERKILR